MRNSVVHTLIFAEPTTFDYTNDYVVIDVNDDLLAKIQKGGEQYKDCEGNAYVFGPLFDIDEYIPAGSHDVTMGQTGFIEKSHAKRKHKEGNLTCDYEDFIGEVTFNDSDCIKLIQTTHPEIKWIGKVTHDAPRVHLHFHVSPNDEVDSIIVDNEYYYNAQGGTEDYDTDEDSYETDTEESY